MFLISGFKLILNSMSIIDDLKYIHQKDTSDALGIAEKQWQQLEHQFEIPELKYPVENIVFTGMGALHWRRY